MRVAFHCNQLCLRGAEIAMYDYAHYNEALLGNQSVIISNKKAPFHHAEAITKFLTRFQLYFYEDVRDLDLILDHAKAEVLYCIKAGFNDGITAKNIRTGVHAVFAYHEPHGDVYAYISHWLSQHVSKGALPYVPHMISLPEMEGDLRAELGIPANAMVYGRYGGEDTFDISFVQQAVVEATKKRDDLYFLFMNTEKFSEPNSRIIYLPGTADINRKCQFINTCNAMLHGRKSGESFGLAVGEFSIKNRPVLTWIGSHERCHIELLGDRGIYYKEYEDLLRTLLSFNPKPELDWDCYSRDFNPEAVMKRFKEVFLEQ